MAYTDLNTIHNPATGTIPPASWGDQIRTNEEFLNNPPMVRVEGVAQSVNTATLTALSMGSEVFDTDTMWDFSPDPTRLVATTAGVYLIVGNAMFAGAAGGTQRTLQIRSDGATKRSQIDVAPNGAANTEVCVSTIRKMTAGQYVELMAYQDSGGAINVTPGGFAMTYQGTGA